jgi:hypothetical protein
MHPFLLRWSLLITYIILLLMSIYLLLLLPWTIRVWRVLGGLTTLILRREGWVMSSTQLEDGTHYWSRLMLTKLASLMWVLGQLFSEWHVFPQTSHVICVSKDLRGCTSFAGASSSMFSRRSIIITKHNVALKLMNPLGTCVCPLFFPPLIDCHLSNQGLSSSDAQG